MTESTEYDGVDGIRRKISKQKKRPETARKTRRCEKLRPYHVPLTCGFVIRACFFPRRALLWCMFRPSESTLASLSLCRKGIQLSRMRQLAG